MKVETFLPYAQIFAYLAAGGSLIFSAFTYYRNISVKRGEWLKTLFEKFFESDKFSEVRIHIEYETLKSFLNIDDKGMCSNVDSEEKLVNYLNFFEFIAVLLYNKHITGKEVNDLFGYVIAALKNEVFIKQYITQFGFENLDKLLKSNE